MHPFVIPNLTRDLYSDTSVPGSQFFFHNLPCSSPLEAAIPFNTGCPQSEHRRCVKGSASHYPLVTLGQWRNWPARLQRPSLASPCDTHTHTALFIYLGLLMKWK